jgi:hypothetical protein
MLKTLKLAVLLGATFAATQCTAGQSHGVSAALKADLTQSRGIFVVPAQPGAARKAPNQAWFIYQSGAIYITAAATDPRVRDLQLGKQDANISIGKPDGPVVAASGAIINDDKVHETVLEGLQSKYPDIWKQYGQALRYNLKHGSAVVIKYTLKDS